MLLSIFGRENFIDINSLRFDKGKRSLELGDRHYGVVRLIPPDKFIVSQSVISFPPSLPNAAAVSAGEPYINRQWMLKGAITGHYHALRWYHSRV